MAILGLADNNSTRSPEALNKKYSSTIRSQIAKLTLGLAIATGSGCASTPRNPLQANTLYEMYERPGIWRGAGCTFQLDNQRQITVQCRSGHLESNQHTEQERTAVLRLRSLYTSERVEAAISAFDLYNPAMRRAITDNYYTSTVDGDSRDGTGYFEHSHYHRSGYRSDLINASRRTYNNLINTNPSQDLLQEITNSLRIPFSEDPVRSLELRFARTLRHELLHDAWFNVLSDRQREEFITTAHLLLDTESDDAFLSNITQDEEVLNRLPELCDRFVRLLRTRHPLWTGSRADFSDDLRNFLWFRINVAQRREEYSHLSRNRFIALELYPELWQQGDLAGLPVFTGTYEGVLREDILRHARSRPSQFAHQDRIRQLTPILREFMQYIRRELASTPTGNPIVETPYIREAPSRQIEPPSH